jgi:hypothetical protein
MYASPCARANNADVDADVDVDVNLDATAQCKLGRYSRKKQEGSGGAKTARSLCQMLD